MPARFVRCVCLFVFFSAWNAAAPGDVVAQEKRTELSSLPLAFEHNEGQAPTPYQFLVRRNAFETFFLAGGMDVAVPTRKGELSRVRLRWLGSNQTAGISGGDRLPGHSNYLRGSDSRQWLRNVSQFQQVRYEDIYPGINLVFHGNGDSLEHDFIVAPGAQPSRISFRFDKPAHVTPDGNLLVDLGDTTLYFRRPAAYQRSGIYRKDVPVRFSIMRNGDVRFKLGRYDHSKALVIDPVFGFSTYLDGSNADSITAVTTDSTGNIYVTGFTASTDFPTTNANNPLCAQCSDAGQTSEAFISKLDPTGHSLLFSTYLGGSTSGGTVWNVCKRYSLRSPQ